VSTQEAIEYEKKKEAHDESIRRRTGRSYTGPEH